jgi:hypothetical protein
MSTYLRGLSKQGGAHVLARGDAKVNLDQRQSSGHLKKILTQASSLLMPGQHLK